MNIAKAKLGSVSGIALYRRRDTGQAVTLSPQYLSTAVAPLLQLETQAIHAHSNLNPYSKKTKEYFILVINILKYNSQTFNLSGNYLDAALQKLNQTESVFIPLQQLSPFASCITVPVLC